MCLSLDLLIAFLNILGPDMITSEPGRFIVHTATQDTHWVETTTEHYCTMGPQIDRLVRF